MKRYPKLVQADKRGQIVIPKDVREALGIDETTGFWVYVIEGKGILLRKTAPEPLNEDPAMRALKDHAEQLGISEEALKRAVEDYKQNGDGRLEEI